MTLLENTLLNITNCEKHKGITKEIATETMYDVSYFGTMMVHKGHADGMVSGAAHTTQHTIRPAFEFIKTKPGISIVSSSFFMCLEDRVLVYGDCAVNPKPPMLSNLLTLPLVHLKQLLCLVLSPELLCSLIQPGVLVKVRRWKK